MFNKLILLNTLYAFASTTCLLKYLRKRHDHQVVQKLNRLLKLKGQCTRTVENITFLRNCLESFVTPLYIKRRVSKAKPKSPWAIERAFLRDDINKYQDGLDRTIDNYHSALAEGLRQLSFFDRLRFCKLLNQTAGRLREQVRRKKNETLARLRKFQLGEGKLQHSTIVNLAGVELTEVEKDVLCRGLNFAIPPKTANIANEVEAEFELCWEQLSNKVPTSTEKERNCKAALAGLARQYANQKVDKTGYPLRKEHFEAIRELKKNHDLIITRPDKGNGVVILRRSDYVEKMLSILSQEGKFCRIGDADKHDGTLQQERALQAFLLRALRNGHISRETYERIRPVGSTRPRMYGLPKTHKQGVPLRPILSMVNAPQHAMARWLTEVLQPVLDKYSDHTIRDSFQFCSNLEEFETHHDQTQTFMCSFDVVSLFTNIPLAETLQICLDALYRSEDISPPTIPESLLKKLLLKATTEVEFSFDGVMYRQIDGVAMGSPLGPVLANIFVGYCESKLEQAHWPLMYNRFVDDAFAVFNNEEESHDFFRELNELHPALKFTTDAETDNQFPFLDVDVRRQDGKFRRSVYRKKTFTGLYTRWESFGPASQKIALIRSLTSRAVKICTDNALPDEVAKLKELFANNGYPTQIVERTISDTIAKHESKAADCVNVKEEPDRDRVFLRLPWLGNVSNRYRKQVTETVMDCYPQVKPQVVFTTRPAFNGRTKDVLPTTSRSFVVYHFTCSCELTYVGRTSQCLSERIKQHIPVSMLKSEARPGAVKRTDSAIMRHLKSNRQCIREDLHSAFKVLAQARSRPHLDILEALYIQRLAPPLCNQKEHVRALSLF